MADFSTPVGFAGTFLPIPDWNFGGSIVLMTNTLASVQSPPIASRVVLLVADINLWLTVGTDPVATVGPGSFYLPANFQWMVSFLPGQRIAAIDPPGGPGGHLAILFCTDPG